MYRVQLDHDFCHKLMYANINYVMMSFQKQARLDYGIAILSHEFLMYVAALLLQVSNSFYFSLEPKVLLTTMFLQ